MKWSSRTVFFLSSSVLLGICDEAAMSEGKESVDAPRILSAEGAQPRHRTVVLIRAQSHSIQFEREMLVHSICQ